MPTSRRGSAYTRAFDAYARRLQTLAMRTGGRYVGLAGQHLGRGSDLWADDACRWGAVSVPSESQPARVFSYLQCRRRRCRHALPVEPVAPAAARCDAPLLDAGPSARGFATAPQDSAALVPVIAVAEHRAAAAGHRATAVGIARRFRARSRASARYSSWMSARSGDRTLLDEAKARARAYVRALPASDRVMVVRADGLPSPATGMDTDRQADRKGNRRVSPWRGCARSATGVRIR